MQRSAICSLEQINLESRKTGTEPAKLGFSCFPVFQILSPPRIFIRARTTLSRLFCPPLLIAPARSATATVPHAGTAPRSRTDQGAFLRRATAKTPKTKAVEDGFMMATARSLNLEP